MTADEADAAELLAVTPRHSVMEKWAREASSKITEEREEALAAWLLESCGNMQLAEGLRDRGWTVYTDEKFEWDMKPEGGATLRVMFSFKWIAPPDIEVD